MTDVLDVIKKLKEDLWKKYGNPITGYPYTQEEVHLTYYVSRLLDETGHGCSVDYKYTEKAAHAAFIAGYRIGRRKAVEMANEIVESRIDDAILALRGGRDDA